MDELNTALYNKVHTNVKQISYDKRDDFYKMLKYNLKNCIFDYDHNKKLKNHMFIVRKSSYIKTIDNDSMYIENINKIGYGEKIKRNICAFFKEILAERYMRHITHDKSDEKNFMLCLKDETSIENIHHTELGSMYKGQRSFQHDGFLVQEHPTNKKVVMVNLMKEYLALNNVFINDDGFVFLGLMKKFTDMIRILDDYCKPSN